MPYILERGLRKGRKMEKSASHRPKVKNRGDSRLCERDIAALLDAHACSEMELTMILLKKANNIIDFLYQNCALKIDFFPQSPKQRSRRLERTYSEHNNENFRSDDKFLQNSWSHDRINKIIKMSKW